MIVPERGPSLALYNGNTICWKHLTQAIEIRRKYVFVLFVAAHLFFINFPSSSANKSVLNNKVRGTSIAGGSPR